MLTDLDKNRIHPSEEVQTLGNDATFKCDSDRPTYWFIKNLKTRLTPLTTNKIIIKSVRRKDAGHYYCYGGYKKSVSKFMAKATLHTLCKLYSMSLA